MIQSKSLSILNIDVQLKIYQFLTIKELYCIVSILNKEINNQFKSNYQFLTLIIHQKISLFPLQLQKNLPNPNNPLHRQYNLQQLKEFIKKLPNNGKKYELPIWGYKTNGGVCRNNLKYWIGKTFMKSIDQMIITSRVEPGVFIEGGLSYNALSYKKMVLEMNKVIYEILKLDKRIKRFSQVQIAMTFQEAFALKQQQLYGFIYGSNLFNSGEEHDQQIFQDFQFHLNEMKLYIHEMIHYFHEQVVIDDINIEKLPSFIKFGIGHVEQISMNRRGLYSNPVKTLFFWGSLDKFENSESLAEELKECKTIQKVKEYLKGEIEIEEEFKNEKVEYLTFDLSNMERQIYPIIWIKIKSDSVLELKIKLKEKSQCFMRNGLLCYIETSRFIAVIKASLTNEEPILSEQQAEKGAGIGYFRVKGHVVKNDGSEVIDYLL